MEYGELFMENTAPIIQYTTVSESVYLWIKNAIIQGVFKPGEHIAQESLTKKLGVSRTPVRDAMKRLEAEGLLIAKPHCGAVVFKMTKEHLTELYEVRILMEQYCASQTCIVASDEDLQRVEEINLRMANSIYSLETFMDFDRQFHSLICQLSGYSNSLEILDSLWAKSDSFKSIFFSLEGRRSNTLTEHEQIAQALKARNIEAVKNAIFYHLKDVVNSVTANANFD